MVKLFPRARRRRPGIYAYRTRKHLRRGTEWGYGGMSTNLPYRYRCHAGTCSHVKCVEKPWYDLKVAYLELRLPWWLGWKWLLLSLETIMIVILRPRYNVQKNPRRSKVPPSVQQLQRQAREFRRCNGLGQEQRGRALDVVIVAASITLMLAGLAGLIHAVTS